MKKILVVLTGGTIGSKVEEGIIDVSGDSPYRLIRMYEQQYGKEDFEVQQPVNILSENMTPETLLVLLKALEKIPFENYRGVIITHGSDTLSYTSAFAGLLFHHVPVPVVLVASNYPLSVKGSNGLANFACAVDFIRQRAVRGVFTVYQHETGENQVFLATRIVEAEPFRDQFHDFSGIPFGKMEKGRFIRKEADGQPCISEVEARTEKSFEVPEAFDKGVLVIRPYPGMDYEMFSLERKPAAVLHYLYHSATACLEGGRHSFLHFAKRCREKGIPVCTASYKKLEGNQYATGDALLHAGVIPLLNCSVEAAYAKLMLAAHQKNGFQKKAVEEDIYFESIERKNGQE